MVKVPATKEGLPAIRQLTSEGYNINVTLLFSVRRYEEVVIAYMEGLEERLKHGEPVESIASVASFFVSRVDTATDKILEEKAAETDDENEKEWLETLRGKTAVANAKAAYQSMVALFSTERFLNLKEKGARVQRLLWGSTSAKNPSYSDVLYVDELIGPNTVNTIPPSTIEAFRDHGRVTRTIDRDVEGAEKVLDGIENAGINLDTVTSRLESEGVRLFAESFDSLMGLLAEKRKEFAVAARE